eukprot:4695566-Alexandrium_andersonii.AAC.2
MISAAKGSPTDLEIGRGATCQPAAGSADVPRPPVPGPWQAMPLLLSAAMATQTFGSAGQPRCD